jgi:hypothetical protein
MIEGSGSGRPKNIRIRRIRILNSGKKEPKTEKIYVLMTRIIWRTGGFWGLVTFIEIKEEMITVGVNKIAPSADIFV